jgi:hypothetical protein
MARFLRLTLPALAVGGVLFGTSSPALAAQGDWKLGSPIFTPKSGGTSTLLMTNLQPFSRPMQMRRYDAVGTLLTTQTVTIGANGSLQAGPAAHSGAPMHVELWTEHPGLRAQISYTDPSDNSRVIPPADMELVGPAYATAAALSSGFSDLGGSINALGDPLALLQTDVTAVRSSVDAVGAQVFAAHTKLDSAHAKLDSTGTKLDTLQAEVARGNQPTTVVPDPRIGALQTSVGALRKQVKGLRGLLKKALSRRGP